MGLSLEFSHIYEPLFHTKARYIHLFGGRGRGGSFTATQYFLHLITQPEYFRGYIMRDIAEDIRESLWRDFKDRITEADIEDEFNLNESQMSAVHIPTGNILLSKGFKKSSNKRTAKLKSIAGATHVLIEEFEEIEEDDFQQLDDSLRTKKGQLQVIGIFNPPSKSHWIWKKWYNLIDSKADETVPEGYYRAVPKTGTNLLSIFSTYKDNIQNLNESFITNLEAYKDDYLMTMVKGFISEGARGRIYKGWMRCLEMPNEYTKYYGLDWGFNDPVALVECENHNDTIYLDEKIYESGLTNNILSQRMEALGIDKTAPIYADSSEPKSIEDLKTFGWNIIPAKKGPGSVVSGIRFIGKHKVYGTERSTNLWMENEGYKWAVDQQKQPKDEPVDKLNHLMDAVNYAQDHIRDAITPTMWGGSI